MRSVRRALVTLVVLALAATGPSCRGSGDTDGAARAPDPNVVHGEEIDDGVSSIEDVIRGKVPGVDIYRSGGELVVRIRGQSSFASSNNALVVIDGVPQQSANALLEINPTDVARVEVLKDAAASIYGMRGQNGVLVVTTKRSR